MMITKRVVASALMLLTMTGSYVFAESAPVYDADELERQFQRSLEPSPELPMPPPPDQSPVSSGYHSRTVKVVASPEPQESNYQAPTNSSQTERLKKLEQQVQNMQQSDAEQKMTAMQSELQSLRDQVEQLTHQLDLLRTQQQAQFKDLDERVSQKSDQSKINVDSKPATSSFSKPDEVAPKKADVKKSTAAVAPSSSKTKSTSAAATSAADNATTSKTKKLTNATNVTNVTKASAGSESAQPNVAEEQAIYQSAYNAIKSKKYQEAIDALQSMLKQYPSGQFASNAHYWLGELNGLVGKNDQAMKEFNIVVKQYGTSPRVADARLKIALLYAADQKWKDAKSALKQVINHHPGSHSAQVAQEQLKQIQAAGH